MMLIHDRERRRQNDVGYLEERSRASATEQILLVVASVLIFLFVLVIDLLHSSTAAVDATTSGDGGTKMTNNHAVANFALFTEDNQMGKFPIGTIRTNILDGITPTGIVVQLGQKSLQIGNEVKQLSRRTRSGGQQNLGTDRIGKVGGKFILGFVQSNLVVVGPDRRGLLFTGIVQSARRLLGRVGILTELLGLFGALQTQFFLLLTLVGQIFAVHFGPLELVANFGRIVDVRSLLGHPRRVDGLLALEGGVGLGFLLGHVSCKSLYALQESSLGGENVSSVVDVALLFFCVAGGGE